MQTGKLLHQAWKSKNKIGSKTFKPPPRMKFHIGNRSEILTSLCSEKFEAYTPFTLSKYKPF